MSGHTPTTEQVRSRFIIGDPDPSGYASQQSAGDRFDAWLAARDRAVKAEALRTYADACREFQDPNDLVTWSDVAGDVDEWATLGLFEKGADQ